MATVDDVAAAILRRQGRVTTKKLQKLVYYAQAWHLAKLGAQLFAEDFQAWKQGPVERTMYDRHRGSYSVSDWPHGDPDSLTQLEQRTIEFVVQKYGRFSAEALSRMSHADVPWSVTRGLLPPEARSSRPIPKDLMRSFYGRQFVDPDVAVSLAAANSALEGVELDDAWQEVMRDVADGSLSIEDAIAEEIRRLESE